MVAFGFSLGKVKWCSVECGLCWETIEVGELLVRHANRRVHVDCFRKWLTDEIKKRQLALKKLELELKQ
jgi:hypothetical protein